MQAGQRGQACTLALAWLADWPLHCPSLDDFPQCGQQLHGHALIYLAARLHQLEGLHGNTFEYARHSPRQKHTAIKPFPGRHIRQSMHSSVIICNYVSLAKLSIWPRKLLSHSPGLSRTLHLHITLPAPHDALLPVAVWRQRRGGSPLALVTPSTSTPGIFSIPIARATLSGTAWPSSSAPSREPRHAFTMLTAICLGLPPTTESLAATACAPGGEGGFGQCPTGIQDEGEPNKSHPDADQHTHHSWVRCVGA